VATRRLSVGLDKTTKHLPIPQLLSNPSNFTSSIRIRANHTIEPVASSQSALRGRHTPSLCCALLYRRRAAESFAQPWDRRYLYIAACHRPCSKVSLGSLTTSGNLFSQATTTPATTSPQTTTSVTRPAQPTSHSIPDPSPQEGPKAKRLGSTASPTKPKPPNHTTTTMAYKGPEGPPPSYPPQAYDAGPYQQQQQYGSPAPPMGGPGPYGPPPAQNDYYGGQQQGYNQPPMQYQQQPMYPQQGYPQQQGYPPQGQYVDDRGRGGSSGSGICAGIMGALACCCCLDCLF
jgi:hypothetical protein